MGVGGTEFLEGSEPVTQAPVVVVQPGKPIGYSKKKVFLRKTVATKKSKNIISKKHFLTKCIANKKNVLNVIAGNWSTPLCSGACCCGHNLCDLIGAAYCPCKAYGRIGDKDGVGGVGCCCFFLALCFLPPVSKRFYVKKKYLRHFESKFTTFKNL